MRAYVRAYVCIGVCAGVSVRARVGGWGWGDRVGTKLFQHRVNSQSSETKLGIHTKGEKEYRLFFLWVTTK